MLSAELRGARDEAVEIIAEPMLMKSYGISLDQLHALNPKAPLTKALPSSPRIRLR